MCEYGYHCPDGIVHCLIQMVWGFFVVNLLFLSICLFIWREYVCVHTSGQAAVVRQQWQTRGRERKERMTD